MGRKNDIAKNLASPMTLGMIKSDDLSRFGRNVTDSIGLTTPRGVEIDPALRAAAGQVSGQVAQTAMGQGPQLSQMQYNQAMQQLAQQQAQAAASARGVNPALAMRAAADATAQQQAMAAQEAAILGEEERRRAQELLLGQYGQQRSQEMQMKEAGRQRFAQTLSAAGQAAISGGTKKGA